MFPSYLGKYTLPAYIIALHGLDRLLIQNVTFQWKGNRLLRFLLISKNLLCNQQSRAAVGCSVKEPGERDMANLSVPSVPQPQEEA